VLTSTQQYFPLREVRFCRTRTKELMRYRILERALSLVISSGFQDEQ
jgi:hypothetical protein